MKTEAVANVLSADTVKFAMPACMVYALVQTMTFMVDTIIAGHFLGTDAVAAIALGMPVIGLMLSFTGMIMHGTFLKLLNAMGRNQMEDYRRIFSIGMTFTLIVACVFTAVCLILTDGVLALGGAAGAERAAVTLGRLYVRTACLEIVFFGAGSCFQLVLASYGYQSDRMISSVLCVLVNLVTSVLFVLLLPEHIRIAGLGFGSALGTIAQWICAVFLLKRRGIKLQFSFYGPSKANILDSLDMLRRGAPSSIDNMLDSVSAGIVNRIILSVFAGGTAVLALVAVIKTINNVVRTVGKGTFYASEPLIGILSGERDNEGVKRAFQAAIRLGMLCAGVLAVLLIAVRTPILSFYHLADNADASVGLTLIAVGGILAVVPMALNAVYESTGHMLLSLAVAVVPDSVLIPLLIPLLSSFFGVTGIWLAMGYSFIPFFIVFYLAFALFGRQFPVPLEMLLRLPKEKDRQLELDVSVQVRAQDITFVSEELQDFLLAQKADQRTAYKAALCMEEIAADYIEHRNAGDGEKKKAWMDIKAYRSPKQIEIVLRNYDAPYNPLVFERDAAGFSKIGISMVQKICSDISYSYVYHLNVISIRIASS